MEALFRKFHKVFELVTVLTLSISAILLLNGHIVLAFLNIYLTPLTLHHLCNSVIPLEEGGSYITMGEYNPWLTSYRIQKIYLLIPLFERLLMCVPGLFPFWLRLWGSKIGTGVEFPPETIITDRSFLNIGDHVLIGNQCYFSPHLVKQKGHKAFVYVKEIHVGGGSFLGGKCSFFAGASLDAGTKLPAVSYVGPNMKNRFYKLEAQMVKL
jgi:hypothetical protein